MLLANTNVEVVKREKLPTRPKLLMEDAMELAQITISQTQKETSLNADNVLSLKKCLENTSVTFSVTAKSAHHTLMPIQPKLPVNLVPQDLEKFSYQPENVVHAQITLYQTLLARFVSQLSAQKIIKSFFQMELAKPALIIQLHFGMKLLNYGHVKPVEENPLELTLLLKLMDLAAIAMSRKVKQVLAKMVYTVSVLLLILTTESAQFVLQKKTKS
jgi:hypothetical protein